jgi:hypothetical protein
MSDGGRAGESFIKDEEFIDRGVERLCLVRRFKQ